jgi:hypothetical protein
MAFGEWEYFDHRLHGYARIRGIAPYVYLSVER